MTNNKTVLDLSKVQHGTFFWINQYGITSVFDCKFPTVRRQAVSNNEYAAYHPDYPGETTLERAKRLNLLDVWKPVVRFQLTANHNISFTGDKAISMWKAWNARIFKKNK